MVAMASSSSEHAVQSDGQRPVSLVVVAGEPAAELAAELGRQGIELLPSSSGPVRPLALVWLPPAMSEAALADLAARLAERGGRRRVGCVPGGTPADRERALAAGFDDVVAGQISVRELAGRLHAVGRRLDGGRPAGTVELRVGRVTVDLVQHRLWIDGQPVAVTHIELKLVATLAAARGQCRSRADLLDAAWGSGGLERSDRAVDNAVLRLRRKLPDPGLIVTVRGVGFRLRDD
jgi:hypothetical protein